MSYFDLERRELLKFLPDTIEIMLDVGCGEGKFGALVKRKKNCLVYGIEPDFEAFQVANNNLDHVENGFFETSVKKINLKFDLIVFNDVLEHMVDPWNTLKLARGYLKPGGQVQISLPNFLHFYNIVKILKTKDWEYTSQGILDRTHLRFFTKKSIERFLSEAGYNIDLIEGINPIKSRGFSLINFFSLGYYHEMKFTQFVVVAKPTE